jgi:hypothetical protein
MEGSMKTMSRSRYHALSWSFTRIRSRVRGGRKRTRRAGNGSPRRPMPFQSTAFQRGFLFRALHSLITIFRTGVVPRETDI